MTTTPMHTHLGDRSQPALHMYEVTPNDSEDLPYGGARGLWINTGGTLRVTTWIDVVSDITVYDGEEIPCAVKRVHATGTTATGTTATGIRAYV
ncbi:MAG: hypothetical protein ROR55_21165 [Devosia sp.]